MKCHNLFIIPALIIAASCAKEPLNKELPAPSEAVLNINVKAFMGTKGSDPSESFSYENEIKSVQLLIFDSESGQLNYYEDIGSAVTATASVYTGPKIVYAMANGPDLKEISDVDGLSSVKLPLFSCNSKSDAFAMFAMENIQLDKDIELTLYLQRFLSRVRMTSISNNLPSAYGALQVKSIRLGNVISSITWNGSYLSSELINPKAVQESQQADLTAVYMGGTSVANKATHTMSMPFYCYRNESDTDATFITVETLIAGKTYYYPIYFDNAVLEPNSTMDINLNIVGLGSDTPWEKVEKSSISVDVKVKQWSFVASYSENI